MNKGILRRNCTLLLLASAILFILIPSSFAARIGPKDFQWYIKDAPPTGPANFTVRTTGYWIALEEDWPSWYTGAKPEEGKNWCTIPYSKRGFYEDVVCEGSGFTNDNKIVAHTTVKPTKEASGMVDASKWRQDKNDRPPVRPRRTIAVNLQAGTDCYIPRWSRVYIKYPEPNNPSTGWYIAEDTGGAFTGKCKIDVFMGLGKQSPLNSPDPTVSETDKSKWPEVWVFPGEKTDDLWNDNIVTYLQGKPANGLAAGEAGISSASPSQSYTPSHPYFTVDYSVNPSFSVTIPYDFSIYDRVPDYISKLDRCTADIDCILNNITQIESENKEFDWLAKYGGNVITKDKDGASELAKWESYCEKSEQNTVNSLAEAIDTCTMSKDTDCVCEYSLPIFDAESEAKEYARTFSSVLSVVPLLGLISFAATELSDGSQWQERTVSFFDTGSATRVYMREGKASAQLVTKARFNKVDSSIRGDSASDLRYTLSDAGKSIEIYKDKKSNITIYPKDSSPSSTKCELNSKMLKFCIVQNKTFFAYDSRENRMGMQQLVLKFAYLFRTTVTDITNVEVYDARLAANTSLIVWDPLRGADVGSYTIYYSGNPAMSTNLQGLSPADAATEVIEDLESTRLDVSSKQDVNIEVKSLLSPNCSFEQLLCQRTYAISTATGGEQQATAALSEGVLYYSTVDNKFFYFLTNLKDDTQYFFAMTATGASGDESPSFSLPESQKKEDPKADVPPAIANILSSEISGDKVIIKISPISTNIDESPAEQITTFRIYCFEDGSTALDTTLKESFYAEVRTIDENTLELSRPLSDFTTTACGITKSPGVARLAVLGVRTILGTDQQYTGILPEASLSGTITIP
jgi:3D (Asp-Asp-Asp) domain-containing protein